MIVRHRYDAVASGVVEDTLIFRPRRRAVGRMCLVYLHGMSGSAIGPLSLDFGFRELAEEAGIPTISCDLSDDNWGNDQMQTSVGNLVAFMGSQEGTRTDKFLALSQSMGTFGWSNYMANNPGKLAGVVSTIPVFDLAAKYADAEFTASIDAAYGGNAAPSIAGHDPAQRRAAILAGREDAAIQVWYSSNDPYETAAAVEDFFEDIGGADMRNMGPTGHAATGVVPEDVVAFLLAAEAAA